MTITVTYGENTLGTNCFIFLYTEHIKRS